MVIRDEAVGDHAAISRLITDAFLALPQSSGTEARIVEALRDDGALDLAMVVEERGEVVGYLAASAATIGTDANWGLIGPIAVEPSRQRQGIGTALMNEAIHRLRASSRGAALVGDPAYYQRFGFRAFPELTVSGCPPEVVQALPFDGAEPRGELLHHSAFGLDQKST